MHDLIERQMFAAVPAGVLTEAVRRGDNILISGGTSTGKTTLLNVISDTIPKSVKMNMTGSVPGFTSEKPIRIEPWIGRGKGLGGN